MARQFYILFLLVFQAPFSFACLNTCQFKIFPVGVSDNKIVSVDVEIRRTSESEGYHRMNLKQKNENDGVMWILYGSVSMYDKNQKLISQTPFDTVYTVGETYSNALNKLYQQGFQKIQKNFPTIEYFKPEYISFCDFQHKCNLISTFSDTLSHKEYLIYNDKKYEIRIFSDSTYYASPKELYPQTIDEWSISSVRILKTKTLNLLMAHLIFGDARFLAEEENTPYVSKEYKPKFTFTDIRQSAYEEPVLHHAYGFDVFVIK